MYGGDSDTEREVRISCPDATGLGCDVTRMLLDFGLRIVHGDMSTDGKWCFLIFRVRQQCVTAHSLISGMGSWWGRLLVGLGLGGISLLVGSAFGGTGLWWGRVLVGASLVGLGLDGISLLVGSAFGPWWGTPLVGLACGWVGP